MGRKRKTGRKTERKRNRGKWKERKRKEENKRILELIFYGKKSTYLLLFFKVNIC